MSRNEHRLLLVLVLIALVPAVAHAETFFEALVGADYASLLSAATMSMFASLTSTCLALLSPKPVERVGRLMLYDTAYAFVTGGFVWVVVEALREKGIWEPGRVPWLLIVGAAGVLRARVFVWAGEVAREVLDALKARLVGTVGGGAANER